MLTPGFFPFFSIVLSREQYRAFEISISPLVPSFVSSYCTRCKRKSVSPSPVLYTTDSLKGAQCCMHFVVKYKCINSTCIYHSPGLCGTLGWSCDKFDSRVNFTLSVPRQQFRSPGLKFGNAWVQPGGPNSIYNSSQLLLASQTHFLINIQTW